MFLFFYGNTVQHESADGSQHNLYYDLYDRLEKAEVFRRNESGGWDKQTWVYQYDALDRRIRKGRLKEDGGLEDETRFVWDGSRLLQEVYARGRYTYVYADQDSYEPLAQIHNYTNAGFETYQEINYFHCDQIGIPREMTDKDGRLLWFGDYDGWGRLNGETNITGAHQPFRLQNQYCDAETGLHYNFYRYYDPHSGRFVTQDPIGLWGGSNFYQFAANAQEWIDPLGLIRKIKLGRSKKLRIRKIVEDAKKDKNPTVFKNKDGILPSGCTYTEHDYEPAPTEEQRANGADRGKKRIVISSDGRIYYTNNHYKSFYEVIL